MTSPENRDDEQKTATQIAEERRAARKAQAAKAEDEQRAKEIDAISDLEAELGDSNVGVIRLPYSPGLPTFAAVRCPRPIELKRFRVRVTPKNDRDKPDATDAAVELAAVCRVYPADQAVYDALCEARPGLAAQLGAKAVDLATGKAEAEGK